MKKSQLLIFLGIVLILLNSCSNLNDELYTAIAKGSLSEVEKIIESGVDINYKYKNDKNESEYTALHYAVKYREYDIAKLLIEKGANVNAVDIYGWHPLLYAVNDSNFELAELLLQNGANLDQENSETGSTSMDYAMTNENNEMVDLLLKYDKILTADIASTDYKFDSDIELLSGYYFNTLTIYDSASRANYTSYYLQSTLPEMDKFNEAIIIALKNRVKYEQEYVDPYSGDDNTDPIFTYELGLVDFYISDDIISLCHVIDCYTEGGNHHNYSWYSFNYDLKLNQIINFKDVFNLTSKEDTISFFALIDRYKINKSDIILELPLKTLDFSFTDKGIYINPELSWACGMNRSLLPTSSLGKYLIKK